MTKMYKAKIKGIGFNEFVESGVWLTKEELDLVVERQYDEKLHNKIVNLGGKFFKPEDFDGVLQEKTLKELIKSGSPLVDSALLESLAKSGYLGELSQIDCGGYNGFVKKLVDSGQYKLEKGKKEKLKEINQEGLKKLEILKKEKGY